MPTTIPERRKANAAKQSTLGGRLLDMAFGLALAAPLLLLVAVIAAALSGRAAAEVPLPAEAARQACTGRSLVPSLEADGRYAELERQAAAIPNGEGKFYRIARDGTPPSSLFGTMHLSDPRILAVGSTVEAALGEAGRMVVETADMLDEKTAFAAILSRPDLLNLAPGKRLADYMTPDETLRVTRRLDAIGIPLASIETLQPWFFSTGLIMPPCEIRRDAEGIKALDLALAETAKAAGKPVLGLESAVEQLEAMASLPMDVQVASLIATLELRSELPDLFETMIALYLEGRIAMITPLSEALMPLGTKAAVSADGYRAFEEAIVTRRNLRMADRLEPILSQGAAFVAVGALHLPGEEGLVELLRRKGWRVERAD